MELIEDVVVLWTTEWWDGPVRGVATGGNRHYWFDAVFDQATDEFVEPRRLVVLQSAPVLILPDTSVPEKREATWQPEDSGPSQSC
jgi:hypothetical protein